MTSADDSCQSLLPWRRRAPAHGRESHVNGGRLLNALDLPDFAQYALSIPGPGEVVAEAPRKLGEYLRDVIKLNPTNFRIFCPGRDEFEQVEHRVRCDGSLHDGADRFDRRSPVCGWTH